MKPSIISLLFTTLLISSNTLATDPQSMETLLTDKEVMSAVRACLQDLPKERDIFVEKIFPMNHGRVNVIIADMEGHRSECVIELTTDKIDSHIPIIEPKGPLFVPNRPYRSPPKGTCFDTKLVMIDKRLQGWLLTQNGNCGSTPSWKGIATSVTAPLLRR